MPDYLIWLIACIGILGIEMLLSTFYLLAFSAGALAASICSLTGLSLTGQITVAAVVIIAGVMIAYYFRKKLKKLTPNNSADNLDENQVVTVTEVNNDGSAKVTYRGTIWTAFANAGVLNHGTYKIDRVEGTRLILKNNI